MEYCCKLKNLQSFQKYLIMFLSMFFIIFNFFELFKNIVAKFFCYE